MRGTIYKVEKECGTRWRLVMDFPKNPDGSRNQRVRVFERKKDAQNQLQDWRDELRDGNLKEPSKQLLSRYMASWIEKYEDQVKQSTYARYKGLIKNHINPGLGNLQLNEIEPLHIDEFYDDKKSSGRADGQEGGLSKSSLHQIHTVLKKALDRAVRFQLIKSNPVERVNRPQPESGPQKEMNWLDTEEYLRFLEACPDEGTYFGLFRLAALTGMRRSELLGLRWEDVDLESEQLRVRQALVQLTTGEIVVDDPKSKNAKRTIDLDPKAVSILKSERNSKKRSVNYLNPTGQAMTLFSQPLTETGLTPVMPTENLGR